MASTFDAAFKADAAQIGGEVYLSDGAHFARTIDMTRARIGGNLHFGASQLDGPIVLEWADIGGAILLSSPDIGRPNWGKAAELRWSNATAGAFQGEMPALRQADGKWVPHDLAGFRYGRLGGLPSDASGENLAKAAAPDLIAWIERRSAHNWPRPSHDTTYSPQPYMQLADALHRAGATDEARALRFAAREHKRRGPNLGWVDWGLFWLSKLLIGHGIYPFMVLAWFGVLVAAGTVAGAYSCSATLCRFWPRFWFSLENALPLVEPNTSFRTVEHAHRGVEWFFHLQKALGFVLATILVGALTLLGGP